MIAVVTLIVLLIFTISIVFSGATVSTDPPGDPSTGSPGDPPTDPPGDPPGDPPIVGFYREIPQDNYYSLVFPLNGEETVFIPASWVENGFQENVLLSVNVGIEMFTSINNNLRWVPENTETASSQQVPVQVDDYTNGIFKFRIPTRDGTGGYLLNNPNSVETSLIIVTRLL